MSPVVRLCRYGIPHKTRLAGAAVAMVVYAVASGGLTYQFKPILDNVLPNQSGLTVVFVAILGFSVLKGLGAYFSVYLMTDVGERLVRDLRGQLFGHILGQSTGFFSRQTVGQLMSRTTNDINRIQQVASQTVGDLLRESVTLVGYVAAAAVFRRAAGARLYDRGAARGLSPGSARSAGPSDDEAQPGGTGSPDGNHPGGVLGSSDRQGVCR